MTQRPTGTTRTAPLLPSTTLFRTGLSLDYSPVHDQAWLIRIPRNHAGRYMYYETTDSILTDYRVGMLNAAVYTQWEVRPLEPLKIVAALRYDGFLYD